jgi:hypothetical protein
VSARRRSRPGSHPKDRLGTFSVGTILKCRRCDSCVSECESPRPASGRFGPQQTSNFRTATEGDCLTRAALLHSGTRPSCLQPLACLPCWFRPLRPGARSPACRRGRQHAAHRRQSARRLGQQSLLRPRSPDCVFRRIVITMPESAIAMLDRFRLIAPVSVALRVDPPRQVDEQIRCRLGDPPWPRRQSHPGSKPATPIRSYPWESAAEQDRVG